MRPGCDWSKNLTTRFVIDLEIERKRLGKPALRPLRIVATIRRAEEWQELLDSGVVVNRAALARHVGVSAMRVSQVLGLLKLDPRVRDAILALPRDTPDEFVSERKLRPLFELPVERQFEALGRLLRKLEATG